MQFFWIFFTIFPFDFKINDVYVLLLACWKLCEEIICLKLFVSIACKIVFPRFFITCGFLNSFCGSFFYGSLLAEDFYAFFNLELFMFLLLKVPV